MRQIQVSCFGVHSGDNVAGFHHQIHLKAQTTREPPGLALGLNNEAMRTLHTKVLRLRSGVYSSCQRKLFDRESERRHLLITEVPYILI